MPSGRWAWAAPGGVVEGEGEDADLRGFVLNGDTAPPEWDDDRTAALAIHYLGLDEAQVGRLGLFLRS